MKTAQEMFRIAAKAVEEKPARLRAEVELQKKFIADDIERAATKGKASRTFYLAIDLAEALAPHFSEMRSKGYKVEIGAVATNESRVDVSWNQ